MKSRSPHTYQGVLHGWSGFTATEATCDRFVSLPASMLGFYDYVSAHCLLPQYHDDLRTCLGLFRGVTASQWPAMKFVLPFVVLTAGFAGVYLIGSGRSVTSTPRPVALDAVPICADDNARLTAQVEALQREVAALKSQASRDTQPNAHPSQDVASTDSEGGRAAEAERHHVYMTGVAQAFSAEKIDFGWAGYASSRVAATLEDDDVLRAAAHNLECRQQTCRLQIDDDGSGRISQRLTMMSSRLIDILPKAAAELVDQGNGRSALVLYMSRQPSGPPPPGPPK